MSWTEIVGPPGVGKTTLERHLADIRVPPCDCDLSELLAAIDREIRDWDGSERIAKRLRGLRTVVEKMPGTDRVICDGPLGWIGAVASRDGGGGAAGRISAAIPDGIQVLLLTADEQVIAERLRGRDGAQRHIDHVALYEEVAAMVVRHVRVFARAHVTTIDTTDMSPEQVADAARDALAVPA